MKNIGIDARLYSQTGVGVYIRNLLYYLQQKVDKNTTYYVYLMNDDFDRVSFSNMQFIKKRANYLWHSFSEQIGFLQTINKDNLDLMHFTYFSYPVFYKKPFIATIHDVTPLIFKTGRASTKHPAIYYLKYLIFKFVLKNQILKAKAIITPTESVKKQVIDIFGQKYQDKIFSIYEGVNYELIETKENNDLIKKFSKPFFIYIGNFYPHKNVENLIKAFSESKGAYQLILIGPKDYFTERVSHCINTMRQNKRILINTTSSLHDLMFFYKNAIALIHPSFSEGFGLPIVEAMYFNLPILASNIEVFKELLGYQYLSFDPKNVNDMKSKIESFIKNRQIFNYSKILKKYSFEKMAEQTLILYKAP